MIQQRLFDGEEHAERSSVMALSLHQPWAWAILHAGKRVENRTWKTDYRGPLVIHAAQTRRSMRHGLGVLGRLHACGVFDAMLDVKRLPYGALVGVCELVDVVPIAWRATDAWACGPWCWLLEEVRTIEPVAWRGAQGLFRVPLDKLPS